MIRAGDDDLARKSDKVDQEELQSGARYSFVRFAERIMDAVSLIEAFACDHIVGGWLI